MVRTSRKKRGGDDDVIKGTLEYFLRKVKPSAEGEEALMNEKEVTEAYRQWHEYTAAEYKRRREGRASSATQSDGRSLVAGRRRRKTKKRRKKTKKRRRKNKRKTKRRR